MGKSKQKVPNLLSLVSQYRNLHLQSEVFCSKCLMNIGEGDGPLRSWLHVFIHFLNTLFLPSGSSP